MGPLLSRRVAEIVHVKSIQEVVQKDYDSFFDPLKSAETFDDLPERIQTLILNAEKTLTH